MRLGFKGEFDDDPDPNIYKVKIYNLSQETITSIKKTNFISVAAGYGEDVGTVVVGNIKNVYTRKMNENVITYIEVNNISAEWLDRTVSFTLNGPVRLDAVLRHMASISGLELGTLTLNNNVLYQNGKSVFGKISSQFRKLVVSEGKSSMLIRDGKIDINTNAHGFETAFVLNSDSGLIGSPRALDSDDEKGDYEFEMCI